MPLHTKEHDLLPTIQRIVRDALQDGLIRSTTVREFDAKVKKLKGNRKALEEYLQQLWDEL